MLNYIVRMETESKDLNGKIKKLEDVLNNKFIKLKSVQKELMQKQLELMKKYQDVLAERIAYEKAGRN